MSFVSSLDRRRTSVRWGVRGVQLGTLLVLVVVCLGPLLWLAKSAVTPTQDTLRSPIALWPNGPDLPILSQAWTELGLSSYLVNTVVIAAGSWAVPEVDAHAPEAKRRDLWSAGSQDPCVHDCLVPTGTPRAAPT